MIAIVDYKAGNLTSVKLAFEAIGVPAEITNSPETILSASKVVFPGVGAVGSAMKNLHELGLADTIHAVVKKGTPFLGICVGTQIAMDWSEEDGGTDCLGIVPGKVLRFRPNDALTKVPQMGWNRVEFKSAHPFLEGVESGSEFYFVHSYYPSPESDENVLGETEYAGARFASIVARGNVVATQFHVEKSGRIGLKVLWNFSRWDA